MPLSAWVFSIAWSSARLRHELNVFVDGELQVLAGLRLVLDRAEHMAARVHGGEHAGRDAVQLRVKFAFEAAEAVVVQADVAQHLRGDLAVGIEALEFFLEVDALHDSGRATAATLRA